MELNGSTTIDLESIRRSWEAITYAVSREKMSIATYLQEGVPHSFDGTKLTIGFGKDHAFHKETLDMIL